MIQSFDNGRDVMRAALAAILASAKTDPERVSSGVKMAAKIALDVECKQAIARGETEADWGASIDRGSHTFLRGIFDCVNGPRDPG